MIKTTDYTQGQIFTRENICGAVCRETRSIERSEMYGEGIGFNVHEGASYKAAWGRAGSSATKHCAAASNDFKIMRDLSIRADERAKLLTLLELSVSEKTMPGVLERFIQRIGQQ